jgi:hypothetical protein
LNPHSQEIAYLKGLIEEFPARFNSTQTNKALQKITTRYKALEQEFIREESEIFSPKGC